MGWSSITTGAKEGGMFLKQGVWVGVVLCLVCWGWPGHGRAQGNFEMQVYGSETVEPGKTMFELHSNSAIKGTTTKEDGVFPTQHAVHETIEITHGFTPWFETGFYLFTSIQPEAGWKWVGDHIRPRVRAPEGWHLPVGLSLSTEIGYQQRAFSTDTWTLEIRPIIDKQWGPWYASFNPVSLNLSHFVARKIWRRRGVSPLCGRAHRLQRREPLQCLLVPMDITIDLLQTAIN
jgi:hypothetical protein